MTDARKPILVFDTETTGLSKPFPVSTAIVLVSPELEVVDKWYSLVKLPDGVTVEDGAYNIHKISTERANAEGITPEELLRVFDEKLAQSESFAAYNFPYDNGVMRNVYGFVRGETSDVYNSTPNYCLMRLARDFCRIPGGTGGNYRQLKLFQAYRRIVGVPLASVYNAHNALDDSLAAADIYIAMMRAIQAASN